MLAQSRLWSNETELLAQVLEMLSIMASERRLNEPVRVRRPAWMDSGASRPGGRNPYAEAIARMRASSRPRQ